MDISRQANGGACAADDTTTTMYLSFDAESTLSSSAAFKTMEDTFGMDLGEEALDEMIQDREKHLFNPLESLEINESHLTMHSKQIPPPLGIYSTNILRGSFCSTPTKEQLLRSVEISRGSEITGGAGGSLNLGLAFQSLDDERPAVFFPRPEENKENAHPENSDGSTLSVSSSVEAVTSVIERKMLTLSTTAEGEQELEEGLDQVKELKSAATTPRRGKAGAEKLSVDDVVSNATVKQKRINKTTPKNTRKSICEPNLQTNRPSRILTNLKKRTSLAATNPKQKTTATLASATSSTSADDADDIPKLINKMMKISEEKKIPPPPPPPDQTTTKAAAAHASNKRKTLAIGGAVGGSVKTRASLLPISAAASERRSSLTSFKQRMSIVVKTTLNSPARKIPRRSVAMQSNAASSQQPRWVGGSGVTAGRRSMLPLSKTSVNENANLAKQAPPAPPSRITVRKSMFPPPEPNAKALPQTKTKASGGGVVGGGTSSGATSKLDSAAFVCSVCASKFRIKSLLDAHKRSHEEDLVTAFVKKSSGGGGSSTAIASGTNAQSQCKYCDKKFALERALHIHLMEKCPKIPPADKRKLQFTEMNHVEKAQLPAFFQGNHVATNNGHSKKDAPKVPPKPHSNLSNAAALSSTESLDKKEVTIIAKWHPKIDNVQMGPPQTVNKSKTKSAHAGVYRTPSKSVPCHICKKSFKSIIELIDHSDEVHPKPTTQTVAAGGGDGGGGGLKIAAPQ